MAMAKRETCGAPVGSKKRYEHSAKPVGYPNAAVICNASGCFSPGLIWLDADEWSAYQRGERYFAPITGALKIAVS